MISTAHANLSVGPPYDMAVYRNGSLEVHEMRIEADHPYLAELDRVWTDQLLDAVNHLPPIPSDVLSRLAWAEAGRQSARRSSSARSSKCGDGGSWRGGPRARQHMAARRLSAADGDPGIPAGSP